MPPSQGRRKDMGQRGTIVEITSTQTYTGNGDLFWVSIHATANTTVTISDNTSEKMSIYQAANTSGPVYNFTPTIRVKTSLVVAVTGTAKVTLCHNIS